MNSDPFWGDDYSILINTDRIIEFFPTNDQSIPERINAISRLIVYISILTSIYQEKPNALYFGIIMLIFVFFLYKTGKDEIKLKKETTNTQDQMFTKEIIEPFKATSPENDISILPSLDDDDDENNNDKCVMPTVENPFMNYLLNDNANRPPACKGSGVQEMAANLLNKQLFDDFDTVYSKSMNERMFRTMPSTTAISEREKFIKFLNEESQNCKTESCPPYQDLRYQKNLLPDEELLQKKVIDY